MIMNTILRAFFLIVLLFPAISFAEQCPGTTGANVITDPEEFIWEWEGDHYSGTMEISEAELVVGGENITTRVYRQAGAGGLDPDLNPGCNSIPGPTITMEPGNKYVLRFRNRLPYEVPLDDHNVFKDPNISNLHTHGLHISGETPGDDVTRSFEGGAHGDFVYDILPDHMGGTFWYHAHHHGSTFLQVSGGAFGLIIIDDGADGIPPEVSAMEERQLVIAYLDPDVAGTGGDTLITGTLSPTWTVNGRVNGELRMPPNTWQHFRVLLADRDARPKTLSVGSSCEVALMARDGVWRTTVPLDLEDNSIRLTGASRADLAVRCNVNSTISVGGTQVASILVQGDSSDTTASPYTNNGTSSWSVVDRPYYLRDLRGEPVGNSESVNMGARTINGSKFDLDVATFVLDADAASGLQRWTLKGARNHPFHLHIYHVQIDGSCADYEDGEYYDVVANNCAIRFDLDATDPRSTVYDGRTIMHCHVLEHEDQGAMGWTDVVGGMGPPTFPSGFDYVNYFRDSGTPGGNPPAAPDNLIATAVSSSQIDLTWDDNSGDEDSFEIDISADGINFTNFASVGADITGYSDKGLSADTLWYYRVWATNDLNGNSGYSNTANARTDPDPGGVADRVIADSITVSTQGLGKGFKIGRADVVVTDNLGGLVSGAMVYGEFSGDIVYGELTGTTGSEGDVRFETLESEPVKGKVSITFCVTKIISNDQTLADFDDGTQVCDSL